MSYDADIIIIGAGGGGPVIAKELGEMGLKVVVLEAGPWYGNQKWPNPNQEHGARWSSDPTDLDILLYRKHLNKLEDDMNDSSYGKFRWGAADRRRPPWSRNLPQNGIIWQNSGVGGTTLHYLANSPRAFPSAIDQIWPISYSELIPYYEKVEHTLPVYFAPTTSKEELFYYGVKKAGWSLNATLDVTYPGYRPQPNAILPPNENLMNPKYSLEELSYMEGCTLAGHCYNGCPHGPSIQKVAKRSTNVSYVPLAMKTGNVSIRPNAFATKILTENDLKEGLRTTGVQFRDTWTGEFFELRSKVVVMAAGSIETPRLWLNSGLPSNPWVGKGITNHFMDGISGIFDEKDLIPILGTPDINPFVGPSSSARLDVPRLGCLQTLGWSPGTMSLMNFGLSQAGYNFLSGSDPETPWHIHGRTVGPQLKEYMANYRRTLSMLVSTDDDVDQRNGVTTDPFTKDEHGPIPVVRYVPSHASMRRRNELAKIAANILRHAGAKTVIRTVWPPVFVHIMSTMRIGFVTDASCEVFQVKRLFIADNSTLYNSIGGPNPTLTTQALATRSAEKLAKKYFN